MNTVNYDPIRTKFLDIIIPKIRDKLGSLSIVSEKNDETRENILGYRYTFVEWCDPINEIFNDLFLDFDFSEKEPLQLVDIISKGPIIDPATFEPVVQFYVLVNNPKFKPNPNKHIVGII